MPHKPAKRTKPKAAKRQPVRKARLWLNYPARLIKRPLIWELAQKFPVVTNIRQASVTDEIGILCLELDGKRADIAAAIKWLEKAGVKVEPVKAI